MVFSRLSLCLVLSLFISGSAVGYPESTNEKTTEAVMKAVEQAESAPKEKGDAKKAEKKEEATAVAAATTEVLDSESHADEIVSQKVLDKAAENAKKTFNELSNGGVGTKAAAAAAAEVAVDTVDGASDLGLTKEAKENAEKAAVAAAKGVADHPNDEGAALADAVKTVKKEEATPEKVDLEHKATGVVEKGKAAAASAAKAVSNLPHLAEGAVEKGAESVENMGGSVSAISLFALVFVCGGLFVAGKRVQDNYDTTPYVKRLQQIREEFNGAGEGTPDLETQYAGFEEMKPF